MASLTLSPDDIILTALSDESRVLVTSSLFSVAASQPLCWPPMLDPINTARTRETITNKISIKH